MKVCRIPINLDGDINRFRKSRRNYKTSIQTPKNPAKTDKFLHKNNLAGLKKHAGAIKSLAGAKKKRQIFMSQSQLDLNNYLF